MSAAARLVLALTPLLFGAAASCDNSAAPSSNGSLPSRVLAREQGGPLRPLPLGGLMQQRLVLELPSEQVGRRATVRLFRCAGGGDDLEPWIVAHPRVLQDRTVKMAGVVDGRYDVEVEFDDGARFSARAVTAPGVVTMAYAAPPR